MHIRAHLTEKLSIVEYIVLIYVQVGFGLNQCSAAEGRGAVLDVFKDVFLPRAPWIQGVHCEVGQV